ncbi:MAG: arabinose transporter [Ramlibacter sp.]
MTKPTTSSPDQSLWSAFLPLLPLIAAVFIAYLAMGMALPVVPRHVHATLGQSTLAVGVVMGAQYASALFARMWAGEVVDGRGARLSVLCGLVGASCVGAVYLLSLAFLGQPRLSLAILFGGRLLTGVAESFIITAMLSWGIARVGPAHAGKVIGWVGMALFAAYGAGAPIGMWVHGRFGFAGIAWATVLVPLAALAIVHRITAVPPGNAPRQPFYRVLGAVKLPGVALTLTSVGYAMITVFITLLFAQRGWGGAALALTSMGGGFIAARLCFGHLPDQLGGARVALVCVLATAAGQLLIWAAPGALAACAGAALTGGGYALAFQAFGVEAVRRAPPESRGAAMGAYVAFQDIAMLVSAPLGGLLAQWLGLRSIYLAGAGAAALAALAAAAMMRKS